MKLKGIARLLDNARPDFPCAFSDLRFSFVTIHFGSSENNSQSITLLGSGACVTESMSVLTDPAKYGIQRADDLSAYSCSTGRTGSTVAADDGNPSTDRTGSRVITEPGRRHWEHREDTDRRDCRSTTIEGQRTTLPKELVRQHTTWRLCTRGRCVAGIHGPDT